MACAFAISLTVSYAISSSALVRLGDDTVEPVQARLVGSAWLAACLIQRQERIRA